METNLLTMKEMIERLGPLRIKSRQSFYQRFGHRIKPVRKVGNKNFYSEEHVQALIESELSGLDIPSQNSPPTDVISVVNGRILNDLIDEKQRLREENVRLSKRIDSMDEALNCLNSRLESMVPRLEYHKRIEELESAHETLKQTEKNMIQLKKTLNNVSTEREALRLQANQLRELKELEDEMDRLPFFSFFKKKELMQRKSEILTS